MREVSNTGTARTAWRLLGSALALAIVVSARADEQVDYLTQVKPLLARKCHACHGALKQQSGLRLDTAALIRAGGQGGPAVEPGKSAASLLIDAVSGALGVVRMPPEGQGEPLSSEEIDLLARWIDQGAAGPVEEQPQPDPRGHWAFQPVARPAVPQVANGRWVRNPIDAFVARGHEEHGLTPNDPADWPTLLRRVWLDLVGLPPSPVDLAEFLATPSDLAYERAVDRLLQDPRYGERWARHWMDVWRYSDWYGRRAVPDVWNSAPQIWRWRDWIVRSLNEDKGYDRMLAEMLAADELAPEDDANAVATGYLVRNWYALNPNQWMKDIVEHTGKAFLGLTLNCAHCHDHKYDPITQEEYFRFRAIFEPIQVRQDWVPGEPDPGPFQKYEYTVLRKLVPIGSVRIFDENPEAPTYLYRGGDERDRVEGRVPVAPGVPAFLGGDAWHVAPVALPAAAYYPSLKPFIVEALTQTHERQLQAAQGAHELAQQGLVAAHANSAEVERQRLLALRGAPAGGAQPPLADPRWQDRREAAAAAVRDAGCAVELAEARRAAAAARLDSLRARIEADQARYVQGAAEEASASRAGRAERLANLQTQTEQFVAARQAAEAAGRAALEAAEGPAKTKSREALEQAQASLTAANQAMEAARQALAVDSAQYTPLGPVYPATSSGRRAALARWLTRPRNPLTARVAVNHLWNWHFGRPLVESTHDLGVNGKPPDNQPLLDWLASELMQLEMLVADNAAAPRGPWQMKRIHRLIVTSNAYRQQSRVAPALREQLARDPENRHLWRFAARRMEAEVLRDCLLSVAGALDQTMGGAPLENSQEADSCRRSLYFSIFPEEGGHATMLALFDAPDPCDCYKRTESQLPQQALALSNGPVAVNQSRRLAHTLWARCAANMPQAGPSASEADSTRAFVRLVFETVLCRPPDQPEIEACLQFFARQKALFAAAPASLPDSSAAGLAPRSLHPMARAAEGLVLALFNHHDFIMIR